MAVHRVSLGEVTLHTVELGQGRPVLLVHGFPLSHRMWAEQLEPLAARYRVIAPDLRGFGASDVSPPGTVRMEQMADDLAHLLDALGVAGPVTLVGLSMGGYIAWQFWKRHRARLAALVLCDTRAAADSEEVARGRGALAARVLRDGSAVLIDAMLERLVAPQTPSERPAVVEALREMILTTPPEGAAAALRGMALRVDASGWLPQIDLPALFLVGQHDAISPPAEMRAMAQATPGAQFVEIAEAGHLAPLESPEACNAAMLEFLGSLG